MSQNIVKRRQQYAAIADKAEQLGVIHFNRDLFLRGAEIEALPSSDYFRFEDPNVWACGATVSLLESGDEFLAEIGWSSNGRRVSSALTALTVYQTAIEFAAYCEAVMAS